MPSDHVLTFDQNPPHRAVLSELGGGEKENNAKYPPDPKKHPTAEDFNQISKQLAAANRVMPLARLWVKFNSGQPFVETVQAAGSTVVPGDFTCVDNGAGDTTIWWTTGVGGKIPASVGAAVFQADDVEIDRIRAFPTLVSGNPAARVRTKLGATGTDAAFILEIY